MRETGCLFAGKGYAGRFGDAQPGGLCKAVGRFAKQIAPFVLGAKAMGETNKHPLRCAQVVRLVSLRRLLNPFDSLNPPSGSPGDGFFSVLDQRKVFSSSTLRSSNSCSRWASCCTSLLAPGLSRKALTQSMVPMPLPWISMSAR